VPRSLALRTSSERVVDRSAHACFARAKHERDLGARDAWTSSEAFACGRTGRRLLLGACDSLVPLFIVGRGNASAGAGPPGSTFRFVAAS
jgi:hypothetical protein